MYYLHILSVIDISLMSIISFEQYVAGQKASVISDVNSLITTFLKDKRTIILAVIPANQVYIHLIDR